MTTEAKKAVTAKDKRSAFRAKTISQGKPEEIIISQRLDHAAINHMAMMMGSGIFDLETGPVAMCNIDLVGQDAVAMCLEILKSDLFYDGPKGDKVIGHGLLNVNFMGNGMPVMADKTPATWIFYQGAKSAACNLLYCVDRAIEDSLNPDLEGSEFLNVKHATWRNIIGGMAHEAHHANALLTDRGLCDKKEDRDTEEAHADAFSAQVLYDLAKAVNVEPKLSAFVFTVLGERMEDQMKIIEAIPEADRTPKQANWLVAQKYMQQHDVAYFMPAAPDADEDHFELKTFKQFLHFCSDDAPDHPDWATDTSGAVLVLMNQRASGQNAAGIQVPAGTMPIAGGFTADDEWETPDCVLPEETMQPCAPVAGPTYGTGPATQPYAPQQNFQQAGNVPQPPASNGYQTVVAGAGAYAATTMDPATFQQTVKGLYLKLADQIFRGCGFNPAAGPNQPFFNTAAKIVDMIPLTPAEQTIVKEMSCYNSTGQVVNGQAVNGWVSGKFMDTAQMLPGYELTLAAADGQMIRRKFLPQNPWKVKQGTNQYSATALEAQRGTQIIWVIDPDAANKQFTTRIYNGTLQSNASGKWTTVC